MKKWSMPPNHNRGMKNPNRKLSAEQVKEIRERLSGLRSGEKAKDPALTTRALAVEYGVSTTLISNIKNGWLWKELK